MLRAIALGLGLLALTAGPAGAAAFELELDYRLERRESLGSLFEWERGGLRCAAGFVQSVQSRVYANSDDLEFWCRRDGTRAVGRFAPLPRPGPETTQSSIANLDGRLFDFVTGRAYDFGSGWGALPSTPPELTALYTVQRVAGERVVTGRSSACPGLAVWVDGAYRGSIELPASGSYSALSVAAGRLWFNADGDTLAGAIPRDSAPSCRLIALEPAVRGDDWVYAYFQRPGGAVFGGSYGGTRGCARFRRLGRTASTVVPVRLGRRACRNGRITEWYSYTRDRRGVLVGTFPEGTVMRYSGRAVRASRYLRPGATDWTSPRGNRHRETQAIVSAAGLLIAGVYPWGEVVTADTRTGATTRRRLLGGPAKRPRRPTPFFWRAYPIAFEAPGVEYVDRGDPTYNLDFPDDATDFLLNPTGWGQRVPNVAVFDGSVCAATGNMRGVAHDPEAHPYIAAALAATYGTIFCAPLTNQTMVQGAVPQRGTATFVVTGEELRVEVDGRRVARTEHSLSGRDLAALRRGGELRLGVGPYGRLAGTAR